MMKLVLASTITTLAIFTSALTATAQVSHAAAEQTLHTMITVDSKDALPKMTGSYQVGTATFDWVDPAREDSLTAEPNDHRKLKIQAWYPIDSSIGLQTQPYIPATAEGIGKMIKSRGMGKAFADINQINTHTFKNGLLSNKMKKYPIVLFSHGLGVSIWNYQSITRELASQGYIVFGIEHTHFSFGTEFEDGHFTPIAPKNVTGIPNLNEMDADINQVWVKDIQFVLNQLDVLNKTDQKRNFGNKLDLDKIAAIGHSFGGAAAARALQVEPRIKAAMNMDGAFVGLLDEAGNMTKPFTFLVTEDNQKIFKGEVEQPLPPGLDEKTVKDLKESFKVFGSRYKQAVAGPAYEIVIAGATHMNFTDMPLLQPYLVGSPYAALPPAKAKPEQIHAMTNRVILSFLDKTLKNKPNTIFDLDRKELLAPDLTIVQ
ncbi:alpha/beta hydrolase family protein [Brevibacillus choshinensis]|uniref:Alpha/beta hydrolase n=1 Tax=Brevibacillus choshinensis TaxID=54911 RepID=A0ABX7FI33_BRECH|nr:alpha/beta fold hydrolase [Brevibacillus choshinensis]QRG65869.1 alpha/beta hydrolase [Brevibacillus choshinensis]